MANENDKDNDNRFGKLERTVGSLESDVRNVVGSIQDLTREVAGMRKDAAAAAKTSWGVLAAWATVVVGLMTIFGYLTLEPIREENKNLRVWLQRLSDRQLAHERLKGHEGAQIQLKALENNYKDTQVDLRDQDTYLQREMRDLINGLKNEMNAKLTGMDTVLQREMRLLNEATIQRMNGMDKSIDELKAEQGKRTPEIYRRRQKQ